MTLLYLTTALLAGFGPAAEPTPSVAECARAMRAAWSNMAPFRADFTIHSIEVSRSAYEAGTVKRWYPADGEPVAPDHEGWMCVFPTWFRYRYIQGEPQFDVTEYPLEVRWNGERAFKINSVSQTYQDIKPPSEMVRQAWNEHFLIVAWQIDFIERLRPSAESRSFLLPAALSHPDYRVAGWEEVDGIRCLRIERPGRDEVWIAPSLNWTLVQRRWTIAAIPGGRTARLESRHRDFVEVQGRYLPREIWSAEDRAGDFVKLSRLRVTSYHPEPEMPFEPAREPGSVWRYWRGQALESTELIPGGGRDHLEELLTRLRALPAARSVPTATTPAWAWAAAPLAVLLGLGGMAASRRGRAAGGVGSGTQPGRGDGTQLERGDQ